MSVTGCEKVDGEAEGGDILLDVVKVADVISF